MVFLWVNVGIGCKVENIIMILFCSKNEDGRAMLMSHHPILYKPILCRFYTNLVCFYTSLEGVPLFGAMHSYDGESMPLGPGQWSLFLGSPCLLDLYLYILG